MPTLERARTRTVVRPASAEPATGERTAAGTALQATWLGFVAYGAWATAAVPEHPEPPAVVGALMEIVGWAILAATTGLLFRKRWALWTSAALALPMVGLAVMCVVADAGNHWIAEAAFAGGVVWLSLHPASWRMHDR